MAMHYDNQTAVSMVGNPTFHEQTKHIKIDRHLIREIVLQGIISIQCIASSSQLVDIFLKSLNKVSNGCALGSI